MISKLIRTAERFANCGHSLLTEGTDELQPANFYFPHLTPKDGVEVHSAFDFLVHFLKIICNIDNLAL